MSQRRRVQPNVPKKGVPETWDDGMERGSSPTGYSKVQDTEMLLGVIPGFMRSDRRKCDQ